MKFSLFIFLGFITQLSFAQCDDALAFTDGDKESFVQVYLAIKKDKPQSQDELLYDLVNKHKITPKQFQEIQHPSQTKRELSDDENAFVSELQNLKEAYKSQLQNIEKKSCLAHNLDPQDYQSMRHQYRSCMRFQRSLSDFFNKWIK